jgi:hypothetical protein
MLLVGAAILYIPMSEGAAAVEVALTIASLVYGGLLGAFFLGIADRRANQPGMIMPGSPPGSAWSRPSGWSPPSSSGAWSSDGPGSSSWARMVTMLVGAGA